MIYQALENTSAAALGSFTTALEKTKTTIAASGRALLKLLSRHKLLVSDQALYLLQCSVVSSLVLSCYNVVYLYSFPDLNLKQQFQVVNSVLFHFILEKGKRHTH